MQLHVEVSESGQSAILRTECALCQQKAVVELPLPRELLYFIPPAMNQLLDLELMGAYLCPTCAPAAVGPAPVPELGPDSPAA